VATTPYVPDGTGLRCTRHGAVFGATAACAACVTDPGPPIEEAEEALSPPPHGCLSSEEIERRIVDEADALRSLRAELMGKGKQGKGKGRVVVRDLHHYNTLCKLAETYGKLMRIAAEAARRREDEEIVRRRERRRREAERGEPN